MKNKILIIGGLVCAGFIGYGASELDFKGFMSYNKRWHIGHN